MANRRKTIEVKKLTEYANAIFVDSSPELVQERLAIAQYLELVLMATNNYHGFNYLIPPKYDDDFNQLNPAFDESRRHYHVKD